MLVCVQDGDGVSLLAKRHELLSHIVVVARDACIAPCLVLHVDDNSSIRHEVDDLAEEAPMALGIRDGGTLKRGQIAIIEVMFMRAVVERWECESVAQV